ncbi:hypothetical protein P355_5036 [Burkholderia cenocepacia KC-01]|nr:hypothetical protein P355_5036 [Burkholderia cenocepacia KC-01]
MNFFGRPHACGARRAATNPDLARAARTACDRVRCFGQRDFR